jgi:hypothetical protein
VPKFEYWDGAWRVVASESYVDSKVFDINSNTSGSLNINRLQNFPSSNSVFLRGDGTWAIPTATIVLPYNIYTSALNNTDFRIYNSNNSSTSTAFSVYNQNTGYGVEFGLNNSTLEGYVWAGPTLSLKFGTNGIMRMKINSNGSIDCQSNDILTTGTINAQTGTLRGNNLAAHNSTSLQVLNPLNMQNNDIAGLPLIPVMSTSATSRAYVEDKTDEYQTLTYASNINWNATNGNVAVLTLSGNCTISNVTWYTSGSSTLKLFVKQDGVGNRTLNIHNIFRAGSTSSLMPLSTVANAVDCLIFSISSESGKLYLLQVINNLLSVPVPTFKYTFDFTGVIQTVTIPASSTNKCRLKILGAGGGQGLYNGGGSSGAGGYAIYEFDTSSYIEQILYIRVGQGGEGGINASRAGQGGWPNGGFGISGDTYPGGGGGRSEVRIGSSSGTILAISGGGGGGSGYSTSGLGAGGGTSGQNGGFTGTGGTQSSGGVSAGGYPAQFQQAGFLQGAGATTTLTGQSYDCGGGGDGYYGGGCAGGDGRTSGGGSGYINDSFPGKSGTIIVAISSGMSISPAASSDSDFSSGYGVGRAGGSLSGSGLRGGNGRVIVEFI